MNQYFVYNENIKSYDLKKKITKWKFYIYGEYKMSKKGQKDSIFSGLFLSIPGIKVRVIHLEISWNYSKLLHKKFRL